ncbi:MAG: PmoA family protein [Tannerella sp.]|nr:PmoA family protein [Tannerella sp.]
MKLFIKLFSLSVVLSCYAACMNGQGVTLVNDEAGQKVDVKMNGQLFTSYIYPSDFEKQCLYPIRTAKGTLITRGFPRDPRPFEQVDHPHHVGSWLNYGDVNGLDFWNNSYNIPADKKHLYGWIHHKKIVSMENGAKSAKLSVEAEWTDINGKGLLKEETTYEFIDEGDMRKIKRTTKLTSLTDTVVFGDNKEGMIAIRMDRAFEEPSTRPQTFTDAQGNATTVRSVNNEGKNGVYRNSEGNEKESGDNGVWGKPAKWVSLSADLSGEKVTVAIVDNKNNPGFPGYSHARGYGLFAHNDFGAQAYNPAAPKRVTTLLRGQSITFNHLIIVKTNGFLTDADMNREFENFNK